MPRSAVAHFLSESIRADATDPSTGQPLWTEVHQYDAASQRKRVTYTSPSGEDLGERTVVFHQTTPLPSIRWQSPKDFRIDLRVDGRRAVLTRTAAGGSERRLLPVPSRAVADAGVDVLLRKAWKTLVYGRAVRLDLWRAETVRFFPYQLRRTGFGRWKGRPAVHFILEPERGDCSIAPASTRLTVDAYTRSPIRLEGPHALPGEGLEVRSALLEIDLPLPGPLSRPDIDETE